MYWKNSLFQILSSCKKFIFFLTRRARNDTIFRVAASLSYTSLIAIVPLFSIGLAIFSAFPAFEGIRTQIQDMLLRNLTLSMGQDINEYFNSFLKASAGLTAFGVVSIAVTSILMLSTIENSLNFIFRVSRPRRIATKITLYWTVITLGPLLLGAAFSIRGYFFALPDFNLEHNIIISSMLPAFMTMILLIIVYVLVPNKKIRIVNAAAGAFIAVILFGILRKAFGVAVLTSTTYQTLYGALAVIPIFLIWMYLAWAVVIFGAVITAALEDFQQLDERGLKKSLILNAPEKRDFTKNHQQRKKLLPKEQK